MIVPGLIGGLLIVLAGGLIWRAFCEFYVVIFRIGDDLTALRRAAEEEQSRTQTPQWRLSAASQAAAAAPGRPASSNSSGESGRILRAAATTASSSETPEGEVEPLVGGQAGERLQPPPRTARPGVAAGRRAP